MIKADPSAIPFDGKAPFLPGSRPHTSAAGAGLLHGVRAKTSASSASEENRKISTPGSGARDLLILAAQVRAVYGAGYSLVLSHVLVVILLVIGLQEYGNQPLILLWAAGIGAVLVVYVRGLHKFRRTGGAEEPSAVWARRRMIVGLSLGLLWGFAGAGLFPSENIIGQGLLTMVLLALAAGSLTVSAQYLPANFAFVIPMLVPLIARTAWDGGPQGEIIATLLTIYLGFMLNGARNINHVFVDSLRMRFENLDFIEALTGEKTAAETARHEAELANRAKSQFLAAASHDLRQPLHALGLFAAALGEKISYPEVRSIVDNINASVAALEALFNELLDVSKLDAGVILPSLTSFPLQPLLDRIVADYGPAAANKRLEFKMIRTRIVLYSDPMLIERILRNLVSNAIRYTPKGKIVVGARRCAGTVRLEVWDTGIGIPRDQQDRVFEEFYQLTNPERDRSKGLGLGLAIVRRLTRLLDHPLDLDSTVGRGSVFRITVPIGRLDHLSEPAVSETAEPSANMDGKHVLFIDDERAVREGMEALLKQWGCEVTTASSFEECVCALDVIGRKPDLIIADYRLREDATGADAIRQLQNRYGSHIPGVLITGDTAPDRILEAQASGYYLLHKPVVPWRLKVFINLVLREDRSTRNRG